MNVKNPNTILLPLFLLNSPRSNSSPTINMMYSNPMVEKSLIAEFCSMRYRPCGPMIVPEIIKPIIPGILNRFNSTGASKMMSRIRENMRTGLLNGV
jgi:hypothetical protein